VEFIAHQRVRIQWTANVYEPVHNVHPGLPYSSLYCDGEAPTTHFRYDDAPRQGVRFRWWKDPDGRQPLPIASASSAVRGWLISTARMQGLPRLDTAVNAQRPDMRAAYSALEWAALRDSMRVGVTITVIEGKDTVVAALTWMVVKQQPRRRIATPPAAAPDPCSSRDTVLIVSGRPDLRSVGATATTNEAARVAPAVRSERTRLEAVLACYPEATPRLRAFFHSAVLRRGVGDALALRVLAELQPRSDSAPRRNAQLTRVHDMMLAEADAALVVRELFAESAPSASPLEGIGVEAVSGSFRSATWTEAMRRMDRHLRTGDPTAMAEARTEATLYLLSRRGEWSNVRIVQTLAAFAPPVVAGLSSVVIPLYGDLPAAGQSSAQASIGDEAPATVEAALKKSAQILGLLDQMGVPGVKDVAGSVGRIRSGVRIGTGKASPLEFLSTGLGALPQDDAVKVARGRLSDMLKVYDLLTAVAGEPDRLISNARYDEALRRFADRTAGLPTIMGWIGAADAEVERATKQINGHRDMIEILREGAADRFRRPYERMLEECTPNLDCFREFADYKVGVEDRRFRIALLIDERAANLVEKRALCWRLAQRGGSSDRCLSRTAPR
jgi:hypothetical protein